MRESTNYSNSFKTLSPPKFNDALVELLSSYAPFDGWASFNCSIRVSIEIENSAF